MRAALRLLIAAWSLIASPALAQTYVSPIPAAQIVGEIAQYSQPVSGATVVMAPGMTALVIDNTSLLALLTVTLPSDVSDGRRVVICSGAGVTLLTINTPTGTIKGTLTSLAVSGYARFVYSATANSGAGAWFRTG
jgi:hypothetical protein